MFSSDSVHAVMLRLSIIAQAVPGVAWVVRWLLRYDDKRLVQTVAGIEFENPIGLSAGFDKEARLPKMMYSIGMGIIEVGSITAEHYDGNPKPWYTRLPNTKSVIVNSGLRSSGVQHIAAKADKMNQAVYTKIPINASVAKTNIDATKEVPKGIADYIKTFKRLEKSAWPRMYTINISCPNTSGGEPFNKPHNLAKLLKAVDDLGLERPVFLKLPIDLDWDEVEPLLEVASNSSLSGITIGNLAKDRSLIHEKDRKKIAQNQRGNLSGLPCQAASDLLLARCYDKFGDRFVFIGVGGVFCAEDAYRKIQLGASLVEMITGMIFEGPTIVGSINHEMVTFLERDGYRSISDAKGVAVKEFLKENT